jgi:hypothetical protein
MAPRRATQGAGDGPGEFRSGNEVRTALIPGNTFRAKAVQYAVVDGLAMFEGDIILGTVEEVERTSDALRAQVSGALPESVVITGAQFRWPNCTVPFTIDAALPNQARVTDAIAHWQANTGFRFVARTSEADFVTFRPSTGCSSMVGKRGGQQFVNLGPSCTTGNTIHEIGHAIGFWHEQSREDRDAFVTIHWDKIQSGTEHNFNQHIADGDDVGAYDYGSIMHYPRNAFSVDGSDTITPVDPAATIGQRTALSAGDIASANAMCGTGTLTLKEIPKDLIVDTRKEQLKEIRLDTRKEIVTDTIKEGVVDTRKEQVADTQKELVLDTQKEQVLDTQKEQVADTIKEGALDPIGTLVERVTPGVVVGPVVQPGGGIRFGGNLPFAVIAPHQAPAAGDAAALEPTVAALDAQLVALAEQLGQVEALRDQLQAQVDEVSAALGRALDAHDRATGL